MIQGLHEEPYRGKDVRRFLRHMKHELVEGNVTEDWNRAYYHAIFNFDPSKSDIDRRYMQQNLEEHEWQMYRLRQVEQLLVSM